jgi:hypothetical protein
MGSIYYIACTATQRVKIGFTAGRVVDRLKALQTGSAAPLSIIAVHAGTMLEEQQLHRKFHEQRLHGEWFDMSEALFRHICEVTWIEANIALDAGAPLEGWMKLGLAMLQEHVGTPLPPRLAEAL